MTSFGCWILGIGRCLTAMWKGFPSQTMAFMDLDAWLEDMLSKNSERCNRVIEDLWSESVATVHN